MRCSNVAFPAGPQCVLLEGHPEAHNNGGIGLYALKWRNNEGATGTMGLCENTDGPNGMRCMMFKGHPFEHSNGAREPYGFTWLNLITKEAAVPGRDNTSGLSKAAEANIRLECLKLALVNNASARNIDGIIEQSEKMAAFVLNLPRAEDNAAVQ